MTISIQLPILFRRTTDEQSIKFATKFKEKQARIWSSVSATWWPGEMKTPACSWHLWSSRDWKCESSIRKRKLQFSSNSSQIDLTSLTHSVPWVVEELDAVDSERYPWFYSGWKSPSEELIILWPVHRVTLFSEEMIQSSFFECLQIMIFLRYFFVTTSSVFCFLFFFRSAVRNRGVYYTRARFIQG